MQEYIAAHARMVERFHPLPDGWREMYDAGVGRHYYWCTKTNKVNHHGYKVGICTYVYIELLCR